MITLLSFCMLILGLGPAALYVVGKIKDPLHPLIFVGAASYFIAAHQLLLSPNAAFTYLPVESYTKYLIVAIISLLGFYFGWGISARRDARRYVQSPVILAPRQSVLIPCAVFFAVFAVAMFLLTYGNFSLSGYVRDWPMIWITAAIILTQVAARPTSQQGRPIVLVFLLVSLIPPLTAFWTYGQRGDSIRIALIVGLYYLVRGVRPRKLPFLAAAFLIIVVLATLAETRIIIGEDPSQNRFTALRQVIPHFFNKQKDSYNGGEEFIFGAALEQSASQTGEYGMGKGLTLRLVSRFAPKEFFPDKWSWFGSSWSNEFDLVHQQFGYNVPGGAAISGVAEGFFELGWFCPVIWFIFGFIHQKFWYRALHSPQVQFSGYLTAFNIAMVYAILQDIYTAEMNMIYVMLPLFFTYHVAVARVENPLLETTAPEASGVLG